MQEIFVKRFSYSQLCSEYKIYPVKNCNFKIIYALIKNKIACLINYPVATG